jgi:hypothetical protein
VIRRCVDEEAEELRIDELKENRRQEHDGKERRAPSLGAQVLAEEPAVSLYWNAHDASIESSVVLSESSESLMRDEGDRMQKGRE